MPEKVRASQRRPSLSPLAIEQQREAHLTLMARACALGESSNPMIEKAQKAYSPRVGEPQIGGRVRKSSKLWTGCYRLLLTIDIPD
jgi:hypothetical protein